MYDGGELERISYICNILVLILKCAKHVNLRERILYYCNVCYVCTIRITESSYVTRLFLWGL